MHPSVALLLTLVMVPTFYSIVEDVRLFFSRIASAVKGRLSPKPAE